MSSTYCATCVVVFYNAFGKSCIRMVNNTGAIAEPCGIPIPAVSLLAVEYVLPARVQIHLIKSKQKLMFTKRSIRGSKDPE